jgi:ribosomal protein S18 acetylase RimI-like enzyme
MTVRARSHEGEVFHWRGEQARLGTWRAADETAYLAVLSDSTRGPSSAFLDHCADRLRAQGYRSVLTSAVAADQGAAYEAAGFGVHQELHFLAHDLADLPPIGRPSRRGRTADRAPVARLDQRCFDTFWGLDEQGLAEVLDATPTSRFRVVDRELLDDDTARGAPAPALAPVSTHPGPAGAEPDTAPTVPLAYAVSGRAGSIGYLQRLAVDPGLAGRGVGRALVADSLHWLRRRHARRAFVNTQVGNDSALGLYRSCGFRLLPIGLLILDRAL